MNEPNKEENKPDKELSNGNLDINKNIKKLNGLNLFQCITLTIIGLYFANQFYKDYKNPSHPESAINMVKSSGYPGKEWVGIGNGLNHICIDLVKWSTILTDNKTLVVEAVCDDLNEKPKKLIGELKSDSEDAYFWYHTKLRAQFLIHVDGKKFDIGYKEISFKFKDASLNSGEIENQVINNSDFGKLIKG